MKFYYFERQADGDDPAGVTVSKREKLPEGDFRITEYSWFGTISMWFVAADNFTRNERELALEGLQNNDEFLLLAYG